MADLVPITVALYGFLEEQEAIMQAAFANADQWSTPWKLSSTIENARVIIVDLAFEDDYEDIEKLKRDLPKAEIVALSPKKPPHAKWHLARQPSGKVSIVGFSQLVLKISHSLKRNLTEIPQPQPETTIPVAEPTMITAIEPASIPVEEDFEQESGDFMPFFNTLDSLLESKPNEKRKRFNES
jgi:hypothetical protein